jgi:hypothetical protein
MPIAAAVASVVPLRASLASLQQPARLAATISTTFAGSTSNALWRA